jgi:hypothetical protein
MSGFQRKSAPVDSKKGFVSISLDVLSITIVPIGPIYASRIYTPALFDPLTKEVTQKCRLAIRED